MGMSELDVAVRMGAATTILLLAGLLFRDRSTVGASAALFAPLALCLSSFLVNNTPTPALLPGSVAHMLSGFTVIFLWWFCLSCFDGSFSLRGWVLWTSVAWAAIAAADRGLLGPAIAGLELSIGLVAMGFGIVAHIVWRLTAERSGDLIEKRRDARIIVAASLGGMLFVDLAADALFGFSWRPLAFSMTQNVTIFVFTLWLAGRLLTSRPDVLSFGMADSRTPLGRLRGDARGRCETELHRRLRSLMEVERIFLDPDLTFAQFVSRMGASERTVRNLVNRELGYDHFRAFLNHHRLAEARRLLEDRRRADDKLITIALDSGFASLPSFNRAFKAIEGRSPGEYRAAALCAVVADTHGAVHGATAVF